jgi:hypothetical protein
MGLDKVGIVITSIFDNGWLERITNEIEASGEKENATIFFIVDHKTPSLIFNKLQNYKKRGFKIFSPSIEEQHSYEEKLGIKNFILVNSDHRRNIGYLMAYENSVDFIISMDDDNFPLTQNFINEHRSRLGLQENKVEIESDSNVYNNCLLLDPDTFLHPRGFPLNRRKNEDSIVSKKIISNCSVAANAGMWTIAPDVDAISWLIYSKTLDDIEKCDDYILSKKTFCPINSQNTSILARYIPAYYFIRMGYDIGGGLKFDRLGDIYSGYFLQKIIKETNSEISFGMPLVTHERNSHNYIQDANGEWGSLRTIDEFFDWLIKLNLTSTNTIECVFELSEALSEFASNTNFKFTPTLSAGFYHQMAFDLKKWARVFKNNF